MLNTTCTAFDSVVVDYEATVTSQTNFFLEFAMPAGQIGEVLYVSYHSLLTANPTDFALALRTVFIRGKLLGIPCCRNNMP